MSFASLFGVAAQSADQSMRAWRELFLQRDQLEESRRQFDEDLSFRETQLESQEQQAGAQRTFLRGLENLKHKNNLEIEDMRNRFNIAGDKRTFANQSALERQRQEHDFKIEEFRTDAAANIFNEQAGIELAKETLRLAQVPGMYTAEEIIALADDFSARGGRVAEWAAPLRATARSGFIESPMEAIAYYDQLLQATNDPNSLFVPNRVLLDASLDVITSNMSEEAATQFRKDAEVVFADVQAGTSENAERVLEAQRLELDTVRAEIGQTLQATATDAAREEGLKMQTLREQYALNNLDPLRAEQMITDTRRTLSEIENIDSDTLINTIRASSLPQQLALDIRNVASQIAATEAGTEGQNLQNTAQALQNDIVQQTMDAVIEEAFVGLDLTKAQRDLAQSELRVAVSTEVLRQSLMQADLDGTEAATELTMTNIDLAHAQMERMSQDGELTQVQIDGYRQEMRLAALDVLSNAKATGDLETVRDLGIQLLTEAGYSDPESVIDGWVEATTTARNLTEEREALELRLVTAETDRAEFIVATQEEDRLNNIAQQEVENDLAWADIRLREEYNDILRLQTTNGSGGGGRTPESTWEEMGMGGTGGSKFLENVSQLRQAVTDAGLIDNIADTTRLAELGGGLWEDIRSTALAYLTTKTGAFPAQMTPGQVISNLPPPLNDPTNGLTIQLMREWGLSEGNEDDTVGDGAAIGAEMGRTPQEVADVLWEDMSEKERGEHVNELGIPSSAALAEDIGLRQREDSHAFTTLTNLGPQWYGVPLPESGAYDLAQRQEILNTASTLQQRVNEAISTIRPVLQDDPFRLNGDQPIADALAEAGLPPDWNTPDVMTLLIGWQRRNQEVIDSIIHINQQ